MQPSEEPLDDELSRLKGDIGPTGGGSPTYPYGPNMPPGPYMNEQAIPTGYMNAQRAGGRAFQGYYPRETMGENNDAWFELLRYLFRGGEMPEASPTWPGYPGMMN